MPSPMRAKLIANPRAVARPPAVGLRLPTMASCGSLSEATLPRTYSTAGASGDRRSNPGYSSCVQASRRQPDVSSQRRSASMPASSGAASDSMAVVVSPRAAERGRLRPLEQLEVGADARHGVERVGVEARRARCQRESPPLLFGACFHCHSLKRKGQHAGWPLLV